MQKLLKRGAKFVLVRVVLPILWVVVTLYVIVNHRAFLSIAHDTQPILTVELCLAWLVFGGAFLPLSQRAYSIVSVALVCVGAAFAVWHAQIDLTNPNVLVWGGGALIGFCLAWLGGAGTLWWRFAQGKIAVDDPDT